MSRSLATAGIHEQLRLPIARGDDIHVEVRRGDTLIRVRWPAHAAPECAAWLRELMRS
jgi:hypothetical protein